MEIKKDSTVLVTGGSGYLASWIVKYLLEGGVKVKTTVRDKSRMDKMGHLLELGKTHDGKLEIIEADLLNKGVFDEAMSNCEIVIHTASPFQTIGITDVRKELVDPAVEGTKNVLEAVNNTPGVERVVLTSSCASIYDGTNALETVVSPPNEETWNQRSTLENDAYSYSKRKAEELAWQMAKEQNRWDLVVINPAFMLGPSVSDRNDSVSVGFMMSMLNGTQQLGVYPVSVPVVDVRDAARAHINGAFIKEAKGRHILCLDKSPFYLEIADILRQKLGDIYPIPTKSFSKRSLILKQPFNKRNRMFLKHNAGIRHTFDNSYAKKDLKMNYLPLEVTIIDHATQIISDGLIGQGNGTEV